MPEMIENRMVVDSEWSKCNNDIELPVCDCCEEEIHQFKALHILSGKSWVWICDKCIDDLMETTGY